MCIYMMVRTSKNNRFIIMMTMCAIFINGTIYLTSLDSSDINRFIAFAQVSSQPNATNTSQLNAAVNSLNFTSAAGNIASLQNNASGRQAWLVSGNWQLLIFKPRIEENKTKPATVTFDSIFDMVGLNGAAKHEHTMSISDFNLTNVNNFMNNTDHVLTTIFNGTSTVTMTESSQNNVLTSIKVMDKGTISLWVDPSKINNHFGNTPIYGIISKQSG